ncbi:MAG TPA: hypothetical protein VFX59_25450 [Polyangiales bacterium]|nr:hypothetical protein [Polyangiales bacterium]
MAKLAGGLLAIWLFAASARADLPPEVTIRWSGACPRPFALEAEVSQLLGGKRPQLPATEFEVEVDEERGGFELTLEVESKAERSERTVQLASCPEAQDAAVLLIATAIDPDAVLRVKPSPPPPPPPPEPPKPKAPPYRWSLWLRGLFDLQSVPGATVGPTLGALWQQEHYRAWLDLRYLAARTARAQDADVRARVDLFAGALGGAYVWSFGTFVVGPAMELELGALRARDVRGQVRAQNDAGPWGSVQLGALAAYRATERFGMELSMFAGVPVWRPELAAGDVGVFYTTAPVTMRLALGARVSLGSP